MVINGQSFPSVFCKREIEEKLVFGIVRLAKVKNKIIEIIKAKCTGNYMNLQPHWH